MRDELQFGQIDIVLLALCVGDCLTEKPRWPRGIFVGLATAIKLFPGIFIVYLLISRRTAAARTAALSAIGWTGLGFVILPSDSIGYWTHQVFNTNRIGSSSATSNQSLRGLMLHLSGHPAVPLALWLGIGLAVAALGLASARRMSLHGNEIAAVAVVALLGALLSPISWIHEYVVIIVAMGAVVSYGQSRARWAVAVLLTLVFTLPVPYWGTRSPGNHEIPGVALALMRSAYGVTALLIITFLWRAQMRTAQARTRSMTSGQESLPVPSGADEVQITAV
jgi:alpha-1,2-mannosyltransferase